jgi:hypothetical protein
MHLIHIGEKTMRNILRIFLAMAVGLFAPFAEADSTSLLNQAKSANATRYQYALSSSAEVKSTSDNKAFTIWWQPSAMTPTGVIVTLHGHASYATDDFFLWHPYAKTRGYAVLALQWWFGGGETAADYYSPAEMYPIIAAILKEKGVNPGTVLFTGYSRGSANSYAVAALDTAAGNRYFHMVLSNSGGAVSSFAPNQQIAAGTYGALPFSGVSWVMYCGEKDPDPTINGCTAMTAARDWVVKYGATFNLLIDDPSGGHEGFMTNSSNVNMALAQFVPMPMTANSVSNCLFAWAEANYSQYFPAPRTAPANYLQYYYRYYASKGNYLGVSAADNHIWVLGPLSGNVMADVGTVATYQNTTGCKQ